MTKIDFENKWIETFAPGLSEEEYKSCYVNQYLWHVFSYGLVSKDKVLSGNSAREAYKQANKENAITIQMWDDDNKTSEITEEYKNWEVIDNIPELYVVDREWKWTYISTHENDCMGLGPYFYKID